MEDSDKDLHKYKKRDKSERRVSKQIDGRISKAIKITSHEKLMDLKDYDPLELLDILTKEEIKRSEKKEEEIKHSKKKETQQPDKKDEVVDGFVKNFTKLAVVTPTELIKAIFPEYEKIIEENNGNTENKANEATSSTNVSFEDVMDIVEKIEKSNSKKYSENLSSIKRLKIFFDELDIDEIFIGKEGFYGALAFTMKDNNLTVVENFLDKDKDGNKVEAYGYATYIITRNHMFDLLTKTRKQVQEISKKKGYRCERVIHSSKNYYKKFKNLLYELKHTSDVVIYTSIDPLKDYKPTEEELTEGEKLCNKYLECINNDSFEEGEEKFLKQKIDKIYDECIKRREAYSRKRLEVIER